MSDFIKEAEWGPGFNAQNDMLDEHSKTFDLDIVAVHQFARFRIA